jgi:hypothetical protein
MRGVYEDRYTPFAVCDPQLRYNATTAPRVFTRFGVYAGLTCVRRSLVPTLLLDGRISSGHKRAHGKMHYGRRCGFRGEVRGKLELCARGHSCTTQTPTTNEYTYARACRHPGGFCLGEGCARTKGPVGARPASLAQCQTGVHVSEIG